MFGLLLIDIELSLAAHLLVFVFWLIAVPWLVKKYNDGTFGPATKKIQQGVTAFDARIKNKGKKILFLVLFMYLISIPAFRPERPYSQLSVPPVVDALYFGGKIYLEEYLPSFQSLDWQTSTIPSSHQYSIPSVTNKLEKPPNFALFILETTRADMGPFNYSSPFAREHLSKETLEKKDITPFLDKLASEGLYVPFARTVNAYTIKSMFATLCGVYPFPDHGNREYEHTIPVKCLPSLLGEAGYKTVAIQSTEMTFDHQSELMIQLGFEERISQETLDKRYPHNNFEQLALFGYPDQYVRPLLYEWVNKSKQGPFFMTVLTSTTHFPYFTPASWQTKQFTHSLDDEFNRYFNTLNYVDVFLDEIFEEFSRVGITKDTIFIFMGDHGLSLRDHENVFDVHAVPYEEAFRVPLIFYTKNEEWKQKLKSKRGDNENWTNLDILPTILDILNPLGDRNKVARDLESAGYEGRSVLRPYKERPKFSHGNPGDHTVSYLYQMKKIIRQSDGSDLIFDLENDPHEDSPIHPNDLPTELTLWYIEGSASLEAYLRHVRTKWGVEWQKKEKMWPYYNIVVYFLILMLLLSTRINLLEGIVSHIPQPAEVGDPKVEYFF